MLGLSRTEVRPIDRSEPKPTERGDEGGYGEGEGKAVGAMRGEEIGWREFAQEERRRSERKETEAGREAK